MSRRPARWPFTELALRGVGGAGSDVPRSDQGAHRAGACSLCAADDVVGNLLQQIYNLADTLIAGRAPGRDALAAIGSAYTLMTFLTSIFIGLSLGAGAPFSIYFGKREQEKLQSAVGHGMVLGPWV